MRTDCRLEASMKMSKAIGVLLLAAALLFTTRSAWGQNDAGALGVLCQANSECESGFCVQGVCCDSACNEPCLTCRLGSDGICQLVPENEMAWNKAGCLEGATCGGRCDGVHPECDFPTGPESSCSGAFCMGTELHQEGCSQGACGSTIESCAPFNCRDTQCVAECTTNIDCAADHECDTGSGNCVASVRCVDDFTQESLGEQKGCLPFRCDTATGRCRDSCSDFASCGPGAACFDGVCEQVTSGEDFRKAELYDPSPCSCRAPGENGPAGGRAALLIALALSTVVLRRARPWKRSTIALFVGATLLLTTRIAEAQDDPNFYAFEGTMRQQLALQAGLANAQVYGAAAAVDKVLMPEGKFDGTRIGGEMNWIWGVTQVPGCNGTSPSEHLACAKGYRLQTIDLAASNFAASVCTGSEDILFCGFYASAVTTVIAANEGERFAQNLFWGVAGRGIGPVAPLMVPLGGTQIRQGMTTAQISAIIGVNVTTPWVSGRVGYLGTPGDRGLYSDLSADKLRLFLTSAFLGGFDELALLTAGIRKLPLGEFGMISAYARSLRQVPPQALADPSELPGVDEQLGAFRFLTTHVNPEDIFGIADLNLAYLIEPTPQLHTLVAHVHAPGFHPGQRDGQGPILGIGGGMVQLPELPSYGLRGSKNAHFRVDVGGYSGKAFEGSFRFHINDPDYLVSFPFARNSWSLYYYFTVGEELLTGGD